MYISVFDIIILCMQQVQQVLIEADNQRIIAKTELWRNLESRTNSIV